MSVPEESLANCACAAGPRTRQRIAWDIAELLIGFGLILAVIWTPRPLQHWLERRMRVYDRFVSLPPAEIRMHHFPDDRARANYGDLNDDIVEACRCVVRKRSHLRPALDLEHANRIGVA